MSGAYGELERRFARASRIGAALGVLHWDQAVNLPSGAAEARGRQLATLAGIAHDIVADPAVGDLLSEAEAAVDGLDLWQAANLREMRRRHVHAAAVPLALVEASTEATARCEAVWREARRTGDVAMLLPYWRPVLAHAREVAVLKGEALGLGPYDALLDQYDPGRRAEDVDRLFADLEGWLPGLVDAAIAAQARRPQPGLPPGPFPADRQRVLAERVMAACGFDWAHGRLDVSTHPFSSGTPDDVRITTRYDESDFTTAIMGVLHETGHALYTRGQPAEWVDQPVGEDRGMTIHESQSLVVEMVASRSRPFQAWLAREAQGVFGGDGPGWDGDNFYRLATRVRRGFIRVDADEVTYPAHVLLRYRLEREMIAGRLELDDLPGAWDDGLERLLGIRPPTPREGCLQDIHWPDGAFGYFPTYTLGALAAAQLAAAARADEPGIDEALARGDLRPLIGWMRRHVHARGCLLDADALIVEATGAPLGTAAFRAHLEARYLD